MYAPKPGEDGRNQPTTNRFAPASNCMELAETNVRMHERMSQKTAVSTSAFVKNVLEVEKQVGPARFLAILKSAGLTERILKRWKDEGAQRTTDHIRSFCQAFGVGNPELLFKDSFKYEEPESLRTSFPSTEHQKLFQPDNPTSPDPEFQEALDILRDLMDSDLRDAAISRLKKLHQAL